MQLIAQKTQPRLKYVTVSFFCVQGDSTLDGELLVRFPGKFYGIWNFLNLLYFLSFRDLRPSRARRDSETSFRTRPLRTSHASVSIKKFPE
jgi:hypothetical protein